MPDITPLSNAIMYDIEHGGVSEYRQNLRGATRQVGVELSKMNADRFATEHNMSPESRAWLRRKASRSFCHRVPGHTLLRLLKRCAAKLRSLKNHDY